MKLTKTDYLTILAAAAITAVTAYVSRSAKTDGVLLFGDGAQPAKLNRAKIGHIERWTGEDGREYTLRVTGARVQEQ